MDSSLITQEKPILYLLQISNTAYVQEYGGVESIQ